VRVLVTGGTGFVGSHSAAALLAAGHEVRVLARDADKLARVFAGRGPALPECVVGDVTDPARVAEALSGCDALLHSAGLVALESANAERVLETNLRGVENAVGGACDAGLERIVYVSSAASLLGPDTVALDADGPVAEPSSAYGRSKAGAERYVRDLQARGAPVRTSYPTAVIGPDDPGLSESNHAIRGMLRDLFIETSSGFQIIDVRDLARLHLCLLEADPAPGRYLAAGRYFPWRELRDLLEALTGASLRRVVLPGGLLRGLGRICDQVKKLVDFDFPLTLEAMTFASCWVEADGAPTLRALGSELRDPAETLSDLLRWLTAAGHLPAERIGQLEEATES
jgi:nucleoside-diphosphate-sugar epimerase